MYSFCFKRFETFPIIEHLVILDIEMCIDLSDAFSCFILLLNLSTKEKKIKEDIKIAEVKAGKVGVYSK